MADPPARVLGADHPLPGLPPGRPPRDLHDQSIEALHRQIRKSIKTPGHFPTEDAARKLLYLAITKAETKCAKCSTGTPRWPRSKYTSPTESLIVTYKLSHL